MQKRYGVTRADVIVVLMMMFVGFAILIPAINQKRGEARRARVLQNMDVPMGLETTYVQRLERTVEISAPDNNVQTGLYHASIPIPDDGNPRITGGVLREALDNRLREWALSNDVCVTAATYETDPAIKRLHVQFTVTR